MCKGCHGTEHSFGRGGQTNASPVLAFALALAFAFAFPFPPPAVQPIWVPYPSIFWMACTNQPQPILAFPLPGQPARLLDLRRLWQPDAGGVF